MDPHWLVTEAHGQLVEIRLKYDGLFAGENGYCDLMVHVEELSSLVRKMRRVIPRKYRAEERLRKIRKPKPRPEIVVHRR